MKCTKTVRNLTAEGGRWGTLTPARAVVPPPRLRAKGGSFSSPLRSLPGGPGWALAACFGGGKYLRIPAPEPLFLGAAEALPWLCFRLTPQKKVILVIRCLNAPGSRVVTGFERLP